MYLIIAEKRSAAEKVGSCIKGESFKKTGVFQGNGLGAALFFFLYGLPFWRLLCNRCVLPPFCPWRWKNRLDAPERLCSGCGGAGI